MDFMSLNAQLQRLPTHFLVQMAKQNGIVITLEQMNQIKASLQHVNKNSSVEDVQRLIEQVLDRHTAKQIINLLKRFYKNS